MAAETRSQRLVTKAKKTAPQVPQVGVMSSSEVKMLYFHAGEELEVHQCVMGPEALCWCAVILAAVIR